MAFVIATAGHIDHGKTALVRRLTGQDTDRLAAEKARGISIDLGFAHFDLAGAGTIGVIDVPGHERFIRNMVAGVHGIDLVLFVVAADDGVMPQSEEHFDILHALGVSRAIFVITKPDLVPAPRIADVAAEIEILVAGSRLEGAPVLAVSNLTGAGFGALKTAIAAALPPPAAPASAPASAAAGPFRMPIDRVFTIAGRGVVITGTALSGAVSAGDDIAIAPGGRRYRLRGLQSHGQEIATGGAGTRLALNLSGAEGRAIHRGDVACAVAIARTTRRFDAHLTVNAHAAADVRHGQRLRLHLGTAERFARLVLPGGDDVLARGRSALVQITPEVEIQAMAGDHFVIRDAQAEHTLGGGKLLDPIGEKTRRAAPDRLARLAALAAGDRGLAVAMLLKGGGPGLAVDDLAFRLNIRDVELDQLVAADKDLILLRAQGGEWVSSRAGLAAFEQRVVAALRADHQARPTAPGLGLEALQAQVAGGVERRLFRAIISRAVAAGRLRQEGGNLALPAHRAGLGRAQQAESDRFLAALEAAPFAPPPPDLSDAGPIIADLVRRGKVLRTPAGIVFSAKAVQRADQLLEDHLLAHGDITAAQFRDLLGSTRKYALALLETFDRTGRTIRVGDTRRRGKPPLPPRRP